MNVPRKRARIIAFILSVGKNVSKRIGSHVHVFATRHAHILAYCKKGERGKSYFRGDYEECTKCGEGRFVSIHKELSIVKCKQLSPNLNKNNDK